MKITFALMTLVLSLGAFAQERVELNSEKVQVKGNKAIFVRTNKTPKEVEVEFEVPMANSICERHETRHVLRTSGSFCGYNTHVNRVAERFCVRPSSYKNECLTWGTRYTDHVVRVERSCLVPETFCAQYGTSTQVIKDTMTVEFKRLPALGDSEGDTFEVVARQRSTDDNDVIYDFKALETVEEYDISQKRILFFKRDAFVVKRK